ncbi:MAG TPA: hypothetical protein VL155_15460 [Terriglobales bacterium]|nr:hypothetical protein [Terriglobales bacterium]
MWQQEDATRLVWVTMLAMADKHGEVMASILGLAHRARVTVEDCEKAIQHLSGPDPYSRTGENDGRRIEAIDGGWEILNYAKYRRMMSEEEQAERNRIRQQRYRDRQKVTQGDGKYLTPENAGSYDDEVKQ